MSDHLDDAQLSRLLDGDLSLTSREAVIAHLRTCSACARRHDALVAVAAALRLQPPATWTADQTASLLRALPRRRDRARFGITVATMAGAFAFTVIAAAPLLATTRGLAAAMIGLVGALTPAPLSGQAGGVLLVVVLVALLAPLAAYPLARWR
jgi:anti-sigma factor RsiW